MPDHDSNQITPGKPIPTYTKSQSRIKRDAPKALHYLRFFEATDIVAALALEPYQKGINMITIPEFLQMVEQEHGGMRVHIYMDQIDSGEHRKGQAFMNALRGTPYYDKLSGSSKDPFHRNTVGSVLEAIDYVMSK